ncbi:hypothetical protein [Paenibacillus sp. y28]|uniref:hypothetical protein n=1 Tax=Paenibacillus sp. y28 TaxID=3129110 RepID=UPI00301610D6
MSLDNCKRCGTLFAKSLSMYCSACQSVQDGIYMQVRNYLKTNPRSTMLDIHENTGIPLAKLLELRRDDYAPFSR